MIKEPKDSIEVFDCMFVSFIRYDLMLDQISPWSIDPELLVDFLFLPDSYFYADSPEKYGTFIMF